MQSKFMIAFLRNIHKKHVEAATTY